MIAAAMLITIALAFHEMNAEIVARTSPTLLDLLIAVFCALMAAHTTIRQTTDTTAAAAGTAIGIALVPPLCVVGLGIGTRDPAVTSGAFLLFVANFSAIAVVAVVVFLLLGYARVDATAIERDFPEASGGRTTLVARRLHTALRQAFGSRYGLAMRLSVPALFLLIVYVPLRRALDDVTWQFRVRNAVNRIVSSEIPQAMHSSLVVDRNALSSRLVIVGTPADVASLEGRLTTQITAVTGLVPRVSVTAVPDARALAAVRATERQNAAVERVDFALAQRRVKDTLVHAWPSAAGPLAGWSFEISEDAMPMLTARHVGVPIGAVAVELLAQQLSGAIGSPVRVVDVSLPPSPVIADSRSVETA